MILLRRSKAIIVDGNSYAILQTLFSPKRPRKGSRDKISSRVEIIWGGNQVPSDATMATLMQSANAFAAEVSE